MLLLLLPLLLRVQAGTVSQGGPCSTDHDGLDAAYRFQSDCDDSTFCTGLNATCQPRQCRRDEFPFGYAPHPALPPLCPRGSFCPDQGSACTPLVPAGHPCQINRDEQCAPPPDWHALAGPRNANGSLCLRAVCTFANASLGQHCTLDTVAYPAPGARTTTVTRDNCQSPRFYCDARAAVCVPAQPPGAPCAADRECATGACGAQGVCAARRGEPRRVPRWQYAVAGLAVAGAMAAAACVLALVHRRLRIRRHRDIRAYYAEQTSLRRAMAALHAAAAEQWADEKRHCYR